MFCKRRSYNVKQYTPGVYVLKYVLFDFDDMLLPILNVIIIYIIFKCILYLYYIQMYLIYKCYIGINKVSI